jgi:hypothetical protein
MSKSAKTQKEIEHKLFPTFRNVDVYLQPLIEDYNYCGMGYMPLMHIQEQHSL